MRKRAKRRRRWVRRIALTVVIVAVLSVGGWFGVVPRYRPDLRADERFGIDVSSHQGSIDWKAVRGDGVTFAYVKATEGSTFTDPTFGANWAGSAAAGVTRGAYHFFTLCTPGIEQAQHFLAVAHPDPASLAPAVDLEFAGNCAGRPPGADLRRELQAFTDAVEKATGRPLLLYVGRDFQDAYRIDLDRPRWTPRWFRRPSNTWVIWQSSGRGRVAGVRGSVDLDVAHGALP